MIDTVCLLIPKDKMTFLNGVSSWELYSKTDQYTKYIRNPTLAEKQTGNYYPRLTGYKRKFSQEANVRMEFSAPKLLFLNNLDELTDDHFSKVVQILITRLRSMGILIDDGVLKNASVSSVHFSKNIKLENGYTVNHLISEMHKIDLRKSFDFAKTRYINDGQSLYAHATSHQLVIYDKVADLGKDKKRAIDKDQTLYQLDLFGKIKNKELLEIIRFEVRLSQKQKMNKVLEDLGFKKNPSFRDIFSSTISKTVVIDYWKRLIKDRNLGIFSLSLSLKDILRIILLENKNIKPNKAIYYLGLFALSKEDNGMRELRSILEKNSKKDTWYRLSKDTRIASQMITKNNLRDWVKQIDKGLSDYKPLILNTNENK